jgi:hypothetical protein
MCIKQVMNRLLHLTGWYNIGDLLNYGIIAGGAVVYAINDFVPNDSVGDIDVYINTREKFIALVQHLYAQYTVTRMEEISNSYDIENEEREVTVIHIHVNECSIPIQLILQEYTDFMDVIMSFDLDYVQCYIGTDGIIVRTDACAIAHNTRRVKYTEENNVGIHRLWKAYNKGFTTYIFGSPNYVYNSKKRKLSASEITPDSLKFIEARSQKREHMSMRSIAKICKLKFNKEYYTPLGVLSTVYAKQTITLQCKIIEHHEYEIRSKNDTLHKKHFIVIDPVYIADGVMVTICIFITSIESHEDIELLEDAEYCFVGELSISPRGLRFAVERICDVGRAIPNKFSHNTQITISSRMVKLLSPIKLIHQWMDVSTIGMIIQYHKSTRNENKIKVNAYKTFIRKFRKYGDIEEAVQYACANYDHDSNSHIYKSLTYDPKSMPQKTIQSMILHIDD